jgi:acyl-CoA thioesterase II
MDATTFLGLEQVAEDHWRLAVTERLITPGQFLFGGCGLGAALVALESHAGRPTIWATAQYLSYAPTQATVDIRTTLAVTGGRVTQARATAFVDDREILTVNAALGTGTLTADAPWTTMPVVPRPEDCPPRRLPRMLGESVFDHIDTRIALGRTFDQLDGTPGSPQSALWARVPGHLEPSAATLAIFGDYVSGGPSQPLGQRTFGRSLDNTIRVATLEPTEWVLCDIHMHALAGGFAQGTAFLYSESGTLLATASQSIAAKIAEERP